MVGISASGRTPYVLGAIDEAATPPERSRSALACNVGTPLAHNVDRPIEVVVGPELIAGSTRMNSGTVQKIVLNVISTATMVRLGKTYGNLMVDLRPTNEKLRDRSARIVARITGVSVEDAHEALEASGWKTKVAATMIVGHVDASDARASVSRSTKDAFARRSTRIARSRSHVGARSGPSDWTRLGVARAFVDGSLVTGDVAVSDGAIVAVGLSQPRHRHRHRRVSSTPKSTATPAWTCLHARSTRSSRWVEALLRDGVVAYQPTLITSDFDQTRRADAASEGGARQRRADGARILRVHLEGPFLSPQRAGTHPARASARSRPRPS